MSYQKRLFEKTDAIPKDLKFKIKKEFANVDLAEAGRILKSVNVEYYKGKSSHKELMENEIFNNAYIMYNFLPNEIFNELNQVSVRAGKSSELIIADVLYGRDLDVSKLDEVKISHENKIKLLKRILNKKDALLFLFNKEA
jgi:hypothetical protein